MNAEPLDAPLPLIVFTDLDGTLLDHETYRWEAAAGALASLREVGAMVVLASSKTEPEIVQLQKAMGLHGQPAIVENGAGVIGLGQDAQGRGAYAAIRDALASVPAALRAPFQGFGDMSLNDVVAATGLSKEDAARAQDRAFSEPGLWRGDETTQAAFLEALRPHGVSARAGGRFLTLSHGRTKAMGMAEVKAAYPTRQTIALGDAPNDVEMLETAEFGVIIQNPHGPALPPLDGEQTGQITRSDAPGPKGWAAAIEHYLTRLQLK